MTDVARYPIDYWRPLLPQFERHKIELDQRMQQAWAMSSCQFVTEIKLLHSLLKLNTQSARNPEIDVVTYDDILAYAKKRMIAIKG